MAPWPLAVVEHCEQSTTVGRAAKAGRPSLRAGTVDPRSPQRAAHPGALTSDKPGKDASYSRAFRPPSNRSWRYARGKCTSRDAPAKRAGPRDPDTARRAPSPS